MILENKKIRIFLVDDKLLAFSLFIITFAVYLFTSCPSIYLGDSGEFVTNSFTLGINHRPGYPLYTMLGRLFIMIFFFLKPVFVMNALSGLFSSLSVAVTFNLLRKIQLTKFISFVSSLIFAFSFTLWSRSTISEVYTLNIFFISLSLYTYVFYENTKELKHLYLLMYIIALGLLQNLNGVIAAAVILFFIFLTNYRIIKPRIFFISLLIGILGISIYAYLHFRSILDPPMDFNNPEGLENLYNNLAPGIIMNSAEGSGESIFNNFSWFINQLFFSEFSITILFIASVFFRKPKHTKFILLSFFILITNVIYNSKSFVRIYGDLDAYFLPSFYILSIFIALGLSNFQDLILQKTTSAFVRWSLYAFLISLPMLLLLSNYSANDKSNYYFGEDLGKSLISSLEPNSVLIPQWDEAVNIPYYLKYVEKHREDIYIIPPAFVSADWVNLHYPESFKGKNYTKYDKHQLLSILINSYREAPIYFSSHLQKPVNSTEYKLIPHGIVEKLIKNDENDNDSLYHSFTHSYENVAFDIHTKYIIDLYLDRLLEHALYQSDKHNYENSIASHKAFLNFPKSKDHQNYTDVLASIGINSFFLKRFDESIQYLTEALNRKTDPYLFTTLGKSYLAIGDTAKAVVNFNQSYNMNKNKTAKQLLETFAK
ncbi:MAG: DUF2723 domain-containing protein [Bacteroidetes bacterium]|nr:DUF2723 domain-containing protein [Bacteroidota bacterium]